jgi:Cof subfamily protein (haloacid dehalogenase superfamily)
VLARLAAVDLDGTLLRGDLSVSERSRTAIRAAVAGGIEVVIVTARSPRSVRALAREAGIGGIAVCANGAILFDLEHDRIVRHHPLQPSVVHRLARAWRERRPDVVFGWELELRFGSEPAYEALRDDAAWPRPDGSYEPVDVTGWKHPVTKLLARAPGTDLDALVQEARALAGADAVVTRAGATFVEVMAPGVGKEQAVAGLAAERGVDASEVVAFGDQPADAGLLSWAGLGVAVANAHPEALAAADLVTASNDEDGVALVLERLAAGPLRAAAERPSARTRR